MRLTPKVLYQFPQCAGKLFQPSNGTEGMIFVDAFCDRCIHQHPDPDHEKQCFDILSKTMLYDTKDKEYPREWVFDEEGWPVCTAWVKWDWNNDGDPDDDENPLRPPIGPSPDPNQMDLFPLYPDETHFQTKKFIEHGHEH